MPAKALSDTSRKTWRGPAPEVASKWARRIAAHLTRQVALVSLLLAVLAGVGAALLDPTSALGQVLLVLVGILISAVLLPDAPHRLWNVKARDLADTVPSDHLLNASREIASAIALQARSPLRLDVVQDLWEDTLDGIEQVVTDPSRAVIDMDYRVQVTPANDAHPVIATSISSIRCVPGATSGVVWVSFCSTDETLGAEFDEHGLGCIGRELIDRNAGESLEAWFERVERYQVELSIDGVQASRLESERIERDSEGILRTRFECGDLGKRFLPIELNMEFHGDALRCRFPVKFSAYYVAGPTQITFEVQDPDVTVVCDEYLASSTRDEVNIAAFRTLRGTGYRIRAASGTVLPPGTGAVFSWEKVDSRSAKSGSATEAH